MHVFDLNKEQQWDMKKHVEKVLAEKKATLWINHDLPTFRSLKHSPQYYD